MSFKLEFFPLGGVASRVPKLALDLELDLCLVVLGKIFYGSLLATLVGILGDLIEGSSFFIEAVRFTISLTFVLTPGIFGADYPNPPPLATVWGRSWRFG